MCDLLSRDRARCLFVYFEVCRSIAVGADPNSSHAVTAVISAVIRNVESAVTATELSRSETVHVLPLSHADAPCLVAELYREPILFGICGLM